MRGKRSKQYRKLMQQYGLSFGFREPYQVLVDAGIIQDAHKFKMDLAGGLEKTLHAQVKLMITQCSMRHLYSADPKQPQLIDQAKDYERRRCNHHTLDKPLSTLDCFSDVVGNSNKHRYVIASQDTEVRVAMRLIPGIPMVYINRSVMIMEPMAVSTETLRDREERQKFRTGLLVKRGSLKRKRDESDPTPAKSKTRGPKGPNPLSVKKPSKTKEILVAPKIQPVTDIVVEEGQKKKRRRRRHKPVNNVDPGGIQEESAKEN